MEPAPRYAITINPYPIDPPIGDEYGFGAKPVIKDRHNNMCETTLHEHWGRTRAEAHAKAKKEADEWVAQNP